MNSSVLGLTNSEIDSVVGGIRLQLSRDQGMFIAAGLMAYNGEDLKTYKAIKDFDKREWLGSTWDVFYGLVEDVFEFTLASLGIIYVTNHFMPYLFFKVYDCFCLG